VPRWLRAEVAAAKQANTAQPDTHDYSEAETRDYFIDLLLKEAGWPLDPARNFESSRSGHAQQRGQGLRRLRAVGRRRQAAGAGGGQAHHQKRCAVGQQQAKLYADCLEAQFGQRPVIFYSNGYEHWIWDDTPLPAARGAGLLQEGRAGTADPAAHQRKPLAERSSTAASSSATTRRAIRRIGEAFERDHQRKALLVMATGAGKTRTVIALADLLMRCNWAKRVLFLADRVALVNQAVNAFKAHLPDSAPVNLVTDKHTEGRVFVSTYPTMMGLIDETSTGSAASASGTST
jgi:type I restriction enzyme R subunit